MLVNALEFPIKKIRKLEKVSIGHRCLRQMPFRKRVYVMHALVKFHEYIPYSLVPDTVNYMEPSQGKIIQKPKKQELSSLFMTHRLSVMHALVKFHEYIPYGLGVMARTRFTIWN